VQSSQTSHLSAVTTHGAATATSGESTPVAQGDPMTAEEQRWYDEMLKKGYIENDYAEHWKNDTHAERVEFYQKIKTTEKEAEKQAQLEQEQKDKVLEAQTSGAK
jgi:hypothetical protein